MMLVVAVGSIIVLLVAFQVINSVSNNNKEAGYFAFSKVIIVLLVSNWILFLSGGYGLFPHDISEAIFVPIWSVLGVMGMAAVLVEWKMNNRIATMIGGLSIISLLFSLLAGGMGSM
jgi:hypothetical protein